MTGSTISGNASGGDGGGILNGQNGHPASAHSAARRRPAGLPADPALRRRARRAGCPAGGQRRGGAEPRRHRHGAGRQHQQQRRGRDRQRRGHRGRDRQHADPQLGGRRGRRRHLRLRLADRRPQHDQLEQASYGGGIEAFDGHGPVPSRAAVTQSTLRGNKAGVGGAIDAGTTVQRVTASTLAGNKARRGRRHRGRRGPHPRAEQHHHRQPGRRHRNLRVRRRHAWATRPWTGNSAGLSCPAPTSGSPARSSRRPPRGPTAPGSAPAETVGLQPRQRNLVRVHQADRPDQDQARGSARWPRTAGRR